MPQTECLDDASIVNQDRLFRRVHITQLVRDGDTGLARVSTGAFDDKELSINIESVLAGGGETPDTCLRDYHVHKLVSITAENARRFNQVVCKDPQPDNPSHGLIYGAKSRGVLRGLCAAAIWVIPANAPRYEEIEAERRALGLQG